MTPRELAEEAREALRRQPRGTPEEEFQRLVDSGLIKLMPNGKVKVMATKMFGDDDDEDAEPKPKKGRKRRKS